MAEEVRRRGEIAIYKANQKNTGAVAQFKLGNKNDCMFLEIARQIAPMDSERPYDWDNKIIVKLGIPDITKMLSYFKFNAPAEPLKLFHQSDKGSKTIELKYQEYNNKPSYYLTVSSKGADPKSEAVRVGLPVGLDEVEYLSIGLIRAVEVILDW